MIRDLVEAEDILDEYAKPGSQIDQGNLYHAACVFRDEVLRLETCRPALEKACRALDNAEYLRRELLDAQIKHGGGFMGMRNAADELVAALAYLKETGNYVPAKEGE